MIPLRVGFFLALKQIKRSNKWTTILIVFVMTLTFLNLVVISGILVGLIQGSEDAFRERYAGDIIISKLVQQPYIQHTTDIINTLASTPGVSDYTLRYLQGGKIENDYQNSLLKNNEVSAAGSGIFAGIDPVKEDKLFGLSKYLIEGSYLAPNDFDQIVIGANLDYKYTPIDSPGFRPLRNVVPGSKVRVTIGSTTRQMTIKGIIKTKDGELDSRVFINAEQLRGMLGRNDYNADEIAVIVDKKVDPATVQKSLMDKGYGQFATIQVWSEAIPQFLDQIKTTFSILGNLIGGIGLVVASITIFIVIFVNIVTRRKYIGILKGIGITPQTIEMSYIFQSIFYAVCGSVLGMIIVFFFLQPYIAAHPINFPFSDGILVATVSGTFLRAGVLLVATLIAGYVPARLIVRKNTLDAILGR